MTLHQLYAEALNAPSDIRQHLNKLGSLAAGQRVVEFGTRRGTSTLALLASFPISVVTYDLDRCVEVEPIAEAAKAAGIPFESRHEDIDKLAEIPPCDFLFCDAMHNGNSVAIQLELGRAAGAHTMASHDTEIFGENGDLPGTPGILVAFRNFLTKYPEWKITYHNPESFGLTVISKL